MLRKAPVRHIAPAAAICLSMLLPLGLYSQNPTANAYVQHNLVSDIPGMADVTDPNLVNPWGLSFSAAGPFWVSNNGKGNSTIYNGAGTITPLVVAIPVAAGETGASRPTGQVNNNTTGFILANGNKASFIFDTEDGTIAAWNGGANAATVVDNSASGAVYKGLAIGSNSSGPLLYAANIFSGNVDVFDTAFKPTTVSGGFADSAIPSGYAPFNIWNIGGKLYVTYAKQSADKKNDSPGRGNGFVSVFDTNGNLIQHLVSNGPLNSPWGVAIAPSTFGVFAGALLVGNFGDGTINAFNATNGNSLGTLQDPSGKTIQISGLWALLFGNGKSGGDPNLLYFTAGIIQNGATHGLLGSLAPPATVINAFNGASNASGGIAPGECIYLTGISIGPSPLVSAKIPVTGTLGTALSSTTVTINGTPAPIVYASASQTAVMVPYGVAGSSTANIVVKYQGQTTASFQVPVVAAAPGLFSSDGTGSGQVLAFNQDGSLNSSKSAASAGEVVVLFGTGEGVTDPVLPDGTVVGDILGTPQAQVTLTIGGQTAQVLYAGSSPGLLTGVLQIEAVVPKGAGTGAVPVVLTVGTAASQKGATLTLQ